MQMTHYKLFFRGGDQMKKRIKKKKFKKKIIGLSDKKTDILVKIPNKKSLKTKQAATLFFLFPKSTSDKGFLALTPGVQGGYLPMQPDRGTSTNNTISFKTLYRSI